MKFYDLKPGMNPRRVRIFMAEKGILDTVERVEVDMFKGENQKPEYLAINSLGTMPALELDDGTVICESVAICRYLEETNPEPPLFGRNAVERAQVEMWNRRMEFEIMGPGVQHFRHTADMWKGRIPQSAEYGQICKDQALKRYAWLNERLDGREFIATGDYTVADITAQCGLLMAVNTGIPLPDDVPHLQAWWERVSARPTARA